MSDKAALVFTEIRKDLSPFEFPELISMCGPLMRDGDSCDMAETLLLLLPFACFLICTIKYQRSKNAFTILGSDQLDICNTDAQ